MENQDTARLRLERMSLIMEFLNRANLPTFNEADKTAIENKATEVFIKFCQEHVASPSTSIKELDINSKFNR